MPNVRISTKYPIAAGDVELLPENKRTWWLRDSLKGEFIKTFPRMPCTDPIDMTLDLPESEYVLGCGDWNVINDAGRHVSQKVYFYVSNNAIHYCKRNELPSVTGATASTLDSYNPFGGTSGTSAPATPVETANPPKESAMKKVNGYFYCTKDEKFVTGEYNCVVNFTPIDGLGGIEECTMCKYAKELFYSDDS